MRVGVDQAFGEWNGPVDPETNEFVYVPIPDKGPFQPGLETPYEPLREVLAGFSASRDCTVPGLQIDGKPVAVRRNSGGAYIAGGFAYAPETSLVGLAKRIIDHWTRKR